MSLRYLIVVRGEKMSLLLEKCDEPPPAKKLKVNGAADDVSNGTSDTTSSSNCTAGMADGKDTLKQRKIHVA